MSLLLSSPPEVVSKIFESCDIGDVLPLSLSCQRLHNIWLSNIGNIIWKAGLGSILSFHEALIAVRITQQINAANEKFELPPCINISSLSGTSRKPDTLELKLVFDLQHQYKFFLRSNTESSWGRGGRHLLDESPHLLSSWRDNFFRAVYRYIIAGGALSRVFQEPFFRAKEGPQYCLEGIISQLESTYFTDEIGELELSAEELVYLNTYPAFNFTNHPRWEQCFGSFADWLIQETRASLKPRKSHLGNDEDAKEHTCLKEVMQMVFLSGHFHEVNGTFQNPEPHRFRHRLDVDGECACSHESTWGSSSLRRPQGETRKTTIIWLGDYTVIEAVSPINMTELDDASITWQYPRARGLRRWHRLPSIRDFCSVINYRSGRPNTTNGHPCAPPPLHLFTFILGKYFGYQFDEAAFEVDFPHHVYEDFIRNGRIFTEQGNWDGMLTSKDPEHVLSYIEQY